MNFEYRRSCYDASWHRRGHFSNQGFGAVIDSQSGKVLDHDLLQRICRKFLPGHRREKHHSPKSIQHFRNLWTRVQGKLSWEQPGYAGSIAVKHWNHSVSKNHLVILNLYWRWWFIFLQKGDSVGTIRGKRNSKEGGIPVPRTETSKNDFSYITRDRKFQGREVWAVVWFGSRSKSREGK